MTAGSVGTAAILALTLAGSGPSVATPTPSPEQKATASAALRSGRFYYRLRAPYVSIMVVDVAGQNVRTARRPTLGMGGTHCSRGVLVGRTVVGWARYLTPARKPPYRTWYSVGVSNGRLVYSDMIAITPAVARALHPRIDGDMRSCVNNL